MENLTLAEWRRLRNISRKKIAEQCGVHENTIINWESEPSKIQIGKAKELAEVLEVPLTSIIFEP